MIRCGTCGKTIHLDHPLLPMAATTRRCQRCLLRKLAKRHLGGEHNWSPLKALFIRQMGRCIYTKDKLLLGGNASLDHRQPKSRGGAKSLSNLQWVTTEVNDLKQDLTHEEFLALCRKVVHAEDYSRANSG